MPIYYTILHILSSYVVDMTMILSIVSYNYKLIIYHKHDNSY